jgi:hypothetical protein
LDIAGKGYLSMKAPNDVCVISELKVRVPPRRIERRIKIISLITFIITIGWFI